MARKKLQLKLKKNLMIKNIGKIKKYFLKDLRQN